MTEIKVEEGEHANADGQQVHGNINLQIAYDDDHDLFILIFKADDQCVFQLKMNPENFQAFAADMIGVVKNYNLYQARKYQDELEQQKNDQNIVDDGKAESLAIESPQEQPQDIEQESVQGPEEQL